jgi:alkylation response protein AidB-like acyl-CoA dehydrogenase
MIDFEPSEDQRMMQDSVAQFAKSTLAPRIRESEKLRGVPEDVRLLAHEMALGFIDVPESAGGQGLGILTRVMLEEELGSADAGAAFGLSGPGTFGAAIVELGTPEQVAALLADFSGADGHALFGAVAWSEAKPNKERAGFVTTATAEGDGYRLHGKKAFIINDFWCSRRSTPARAGAGSGPSSSRRTTPG